MERMLSGWMGRLRNFLVDDESSALLINAGSFCYPYMTKAATSFFPSTAAFTAHNTLLFINESTRETQIIRHATVNDILPGAVELDIESTNNLSR